MCIKDFRQLVLHVVLLALGRWMPVGTHTFGVCVQTGTQHAGARSINNSLKLQSLYLLLTFNWKSCTIANSLVY
jgi:hypothetical protein